MEEGKAISTNHQREGFRISSQYETITFWRTFQYLEHDGFKCIARCIHLSGLWLDATPGSWIEPVLDCFASKCIWKYSSAGLISARKRIYVRNNLYKQKHFIHNFFLLGVTFWPSKPFVLKVLLPLALCSKACFCLSQQQWNDGQESRRIVLSLHKAANCSRHKLRTPLPPSKLHTDGTCRISLIKLEYRNEKNLLRCNASTSKNKVLK